MIFSLQYFDKKFVHQHFEKHIMKTTIVICISALFFCFFGEINGAVYRKQYKPTCKPGSVWTRYIDLVPSENIVVCLQLKCSPDGIGVSTKDCPQRECPLEDVISLTKGDKTKDFPHCCDKFECKENSNEFYNVKVI